MDFGALFQLWKGALLNPNEEYYREQLKMMDFRQGAIGVLLAAVITAVITGLGTFIAIGNSTDALMPLFKEMGMSAAEVEMIFAASQPSFFGSFLSALFGSIIGFFVGAGFYWLIAKLFGGDGSYEEQTYLMSLYTAPLMIINAVLFLIPFVGGLAAILLGFYQLVLSYVAIKTSHRLTSGRAAMVILLPIIFGFLCACCGFFLLFGSIAAAVGSGGFAP
jgi:hypothetical protein